MNKKEIGPVLLFLLLFVLVYHMTFPQQQQLTTIKLYVPENDAPFFKRGHDIEIFDDIILVLENPKHHILTYSINDSDQLIFKGFLAEKGQGPGDVVLPIEMSIWEDKVAIIDSTACSFFSKGTSPNDKGIFLKKFKVLTGRVSFVYTANKIYFANPDPNSQFFIDVYSIEGKKIFQFGKDFILINYDLNKKIDRKFVKSIFYRGKLISDGKQIYYLNKAFGKVFVFDLKGKLVKTRSIELYFEPKQSAEILETYNKLLKEGIKREKDGSLSVVTPTFFRDAYLCNEKIYILNSLRECRISPYIKIRVLDKNSLNLLTTLIIKKNSDDEWIRSIAVKEVNKKPIIFATMETEEGNVIAKFGE
jgi:hypothetical protein